MTIDKKKPTQLSQVFGNNDRKRINIITFFLLIYLPTTIRVCNTWLCVSDERFYMDKAGMKEKAKTYC